MCFGLVPPSFLDFLGCTNTCNLASVGASVLWSPRYKIAGTESEAHFL
jgi:hypothetical protein